MAIKTKSIKQNIEVTESLTCDNCSADIPLVFTDPEGPTQQGDNALIIRFIGGYGMYVDPLVQFDLEVLWCHKCADSLADMYPSIGKRISRHLPQAPKSRAGTQ